MKKSIFTVETPIDEGVLLFNTVNTALVRLTYSEQTWYKQILESESMVYSEEQLAFREQLSELGIIVDNDTDEFCELVQKYWLFRNSTDYVKAVIAPTTNCNLSCSYCFENGAHRSNMSFQTCDTISIEIRQKMLQWGTKGFALIWYGGEPLLSWHIIERLTKDLSEFCRNNKIQFNASVVTNGVLLNPKIIIAMEQMGFHSIQITLDGDEVFHNSVRYLSDGSETFNTIFENIRMCCNYFNTTVRVNVSKNNVNRIKKLIDYFITQKALDVVLYFAPVEPLVGFDDNLCYTPEQFAPIQAELIEYAVKGGIPKCVSLPIPRFGFCEAVSANNFLFDPEGNTFFCWENVGRKELTNASPNNSDEYMRLHNFFVNTYSFHRDECEKCNIFPLCLGGCPQRKLESGKAPCSPLRYNIHEIVKTYYYNVFQNGSII